MSVCPGCARELGSQGFPFCPWCGQPLDETTSPGQRKTVTVLFADLVESTALGSAVDPEVFRSLLGEYWLRARTVVEAHGGTVEKFIGDAVFGVFGIPTLHEDDALRAVRAASDLVSEVDALAEATAPRGVRLSVRVGVNTGEVLTGDGLDVLVSGDASNVAARLQTSAKPGHVLLGDSTHHLVRDAVVAEPLEPFLVKGKAEPITAYQLVSVIPANRSARRRRYRGPMLARERPLALAQNLYDTAAAGSTCVVLTVVGEPGVGKSRLVDEALQSVVADTNVLFGRCLPYGQGFPLAPLADMITRVREQRSGAWPELLDVDPFADRVVAGLEALVAGSTSVSVDEIGWAFRRLLEAMASRQPVVVVMDDLQWGEAGLVELLNALPAKLRSSPVVLVVMGRPELVASPGWAPGGPNTCTITLQPLPGAVCRDLVGQMLGPQVSDELKEQLAGAAGGIPLFVEETVAMMVDDGLLVPEPAGGWSVAPGVRDVPIPGTVRALLDARLDLLPADERSVLEAAAVIGKTFYPAALPSLVTAQVDVELCLDGLLRADLVAPADTDLSGFDALGFNHLLVVDAAYEAQPKSRRARQHVAVARWLQEGSGRHANDAIVVSHLERALGYQEELGTADPALRAEVVDALVELSRRQLVMGDARAATRCAQRATALSGRRRVEPLLAWSLAATMAGENDAMPLAEEAVALADTVGDRSGYWLARLQLETLRSYVAMEHRLQDSFSLTDEVLAAVSDDHIVRAEALTLRATAYVQACRYREGAAAALEAAREALLAPEKPGRFGELVTIVSLPGELGDATLAETDAALDDLEEWLGFDLGVRRDLADVRLWLLAWAGEVARALDRMNAKVELLLDQGSVQWAASWFASGIAWCHRWTGDVAGEEASLRRCIELHEATAAPAMTSTSHAELALLLAVDGRGDEARVHLAYSRDVSQQGDLVNDIYWAAVDGCLAGRAGQVREAEDAFATSLRLLAPTELLEMQAQVWLARSHTREFMGDWAGALEAARQALDLMERKEFPVPIAFLQQRVDDLLTRRPWPHEFSVVPEAWRSLD